MKKIFLIFLFLSFSLISFSNACSDGGDYAGDSSYSYDTTVSIPTGDSVTEGVTNPDITGLGTSTINIDSTTPTTPEVPAGLTSDTQMQAIMDVIKKASGGTEKAPTTPEVPAGLSGNSQMDAITDVIKKASKLTSGG